MTHTSREALLAAIEPVQEDPIRVAAILWTWLEQHPLTLGELRRKPPEIRADALKLPPFERLEDEQRRRLELAPIPTAAELLVRVDKRLTQDPPTGAHKVSAVDGTDVLVMWKRARLITLVRDDLEPPAVLEQPSLAKLAPRLVVCPVEHAQVTLRDLDLHGFAWNAACNLLEQGCADRTLTIHLESLGDAGLEPSEDGVPGWKTDEVHAVGWFDEGELGEPTEAECLAAASSAVRAAAGPGPTVLILPELLATVKVERAIADTVRELGEEGRSPALTVLGLYHRVADADDAAPLDPCERELLGDAELATRVNEAVVLGPDGRELWRHRKLSGAQLYARAQRGDGPLPSEDIRLGRRLELADSPLGWIAVLICIDVFAGHLGERLEHCGADVLLVPSLSPTVHRHRNALQLLVQKLWGAGFVCNRAPSRPEGNGSRWNDLKNRSFWALARCRPVILPEAVGTTSFVFTLADSVHADPPGIQA